VCGALELNREDGKQVYICDIVTQQSNSLHCQLLSIALDRLDVKRGCVEENLLRVPVVLKFL
jgi:hypothetical protein